MNLDDQRADSLKPLKTIEPDGFRFDQRVPREISQLDGVCEQTDITDALTPKRVKRKHNESPEPNSGHQTPKKQRTDINTELNIFEEDMEILPKPEPTPKRKYNKRSIDETLKAKKEEKMKFIQNFVKISLKYSQFLENKINIKDTHSATDTKVRLDITKNLKYFQGSLRDYQIEGVTWLTVLFENSVNGILADEMGLGKTIQIIALFCHLYERKVPGPFLIVAPLSTLGNWLGEFEKFAPKIPVLRLQGIESERMLQKRDIRKKFILDGRVVSPVIICSYQVPQLEEAFLKTFCWQYIVVDEGHRIKNPESKLSQELRALNSVNRSLLTGTPLQNNIKELWALFNFLMPELFNDIQGFSSLIELEDMKDKDKILENEAKTKIISTIHQVLAPFMLRREKKYVLTDLVPKKEVVIYCPLTELQQYIYRAILQKDVNKLLMAKPQEKDFNSLRSKRKCTMKKINYAEIMNDDSLVTISDLVQKKLALELPTNEHVPVKCPDCKYVCRITMTNITMMLKKVINHPYLIWQPIDPENKDRALFIDEDLIKHSGKLMVLDAILPKLKTRGHKVLIFSTLVMFMDLIEEFLILRGYNYRRLDGRTNYENRNDNITDFSSDSSVFIFLISTRAGGLGLNLTAADTVIFMDRDWNPMVDIQAQDRCHRIGQIKPVMIYSLIVKNTLDEIIVARGEMKKRLESIVIKEGKFKTLKKNVTDTELQELEDLLNKETELTKIHANRLLYTDKELNNILDRSELIQQMENNVKKNTI